MGMEGSSAEGERARAVASFLRRPLRKSTEVSRSRCEGGMSSGGRVSGISLPLSSGVGRLGEEGLLVVLDQGEGWADGWRNMSG